MNTERLDCKLSVRLTADQNRRLAKIAAEVNQRPATLARRAVVAWIGVVERKTKGAR